ncbi:hypothetical protein ElyMa_003512700 [Elysia marginata]|uniref:Uncharacterized protein n=1 Tax=Elysia marginata TaxID=1093978 RepID=A0AAV4EEX9_9GAST|nr:hypothetical protein ElyMa_003512700 [Elysia marginata]
MEAAWRIFDRHDSSKCHERYPSVVQLAVYLHNGQRVHFNENKAAQVTAAAPPNTTLTNFMLLCATGDFAKQINYTEVPNFYTGDKSSTTWKRRKRQKQKDTPGIFETPTLERIYTVSPKQGECFCLRFLLLTLKGLISLDALITYKGHTSLTYRESCIARRLLENDSMQRLALEEAVVTSFPQQLRNLFAVLLTQTSPANPAAQ